MARILAVVASSFACPAPAQDAPLERHDDHRAIFTFSLENDVLTGDDDAYTNGVRIAVLSAENNAPPWLERLAEIGPLFAREGHKRWGFALGQSMYTPADLTRSDLIADDRPYAGWLYASFGVSSDTLYSLDSFQLTLGLVGPGSGAERTQKFVHDVIDSTDPQGWDNQLANEPGVVLTYDRKWRGLYEFSPFGWGVDITPGAGVSLGNVFTHASASAVARFGYDLPADYGPPLIRPSLAGSDFFTPSRNVGWYLFAGLEGRAVGRNIFLDGNTFEDSHSVDRNVFVGSAQGGVAFTWDSIRLAFTHIIYSKEFEEQKKNEQFSAMTVSYRF